MNTYAWATDIHLDHLRNNEAEIVAFAESLIKTNPTGVFLTGDISNSKQIVYHMSILERVVQRPIYFVLGNHDYYGNRIAEVRKTMRELGNISSFLKYMPNVPYLALSNSTAVVGHDGWYDALNGDANRSRFMMSDWSYIGDYPDNGATIGIRNGDFPVVDKSKVIEVSRKLAHEAVTHVHNGIKAAVRYHSSIVVLTHVPPFEESHIFEGEVGDAEAQPWFTSKMMGDMLLDAAKAFPKVHFEVFAGHTHGAYDGQHAPNMNVHVGGADYGNPKLQKIIKIG